MKQLSNMQVSDNPILKSTETLALVSALDCLGQRLFPHTTRGSFLLSWKDRKSDEVELTDILSFNLANGVFDCEFSGGRHEPSTAFIKRSLGEIGSLLEPEMMQAIKRRVFFDDNTCSVIVSAEKGYFIISSCLARENSHFRHKAAMRGFCYGTALTLHEMRPQDSRLRRACQGFREEFDKAVVEFAYDSDFEDLPEKVEINIQDILQACPTTALQTWHNTKTMSKFVS